MHADYTNAPEVREAETIAASLVELTAGYRITTADQYAAGASQLKQVKGAQKRLEDLRTSITKPLNATLAAVNTLFKGPAERMAQAERTIKQELARYADEQERLRIEEQRKAEAAARAAREKAEAAALAARQKAEAEAAELRRKAEAEAAAGRAEAAAALAAKAEQKIERAEDKAATLDATAAAIVAPIITRAPPKVAGLASREVWKFQITDPAAIPREYLTIDEQKIGRVVRALQAETSIPGVRVYSERQIAAGAA